MRPAQLAGLGHEQAAVGRQAGEHRLFEGEAAHEASRRTRQRRNTSRRSSRPRRRPCCQLQPRRVVKEKLMQGWSMLKTKMAVTGPVAERNYTMGLNAQPSSA
ncbi:hypothetical protein F443_16564 [Phytophthora nicotianae P1569]|uniref:Uncharacterized protein n=1 Tax=Phytophthora nicotianae P1569 TaxID=1317065 RepID=V9DVJ8_PHYNI|nr:hypothetical protein F443_22844 [Phytophthora nicotianae P1569]ETI37443.1 hypothetical protein F443_16564 [Phytophthora nicotianae P1569]